ncbi:MAG: HlyD family efflux transporter periplasmic adaptor subunit [Terriglobales bacterium]
MNIVEALNVALPEIPERLARQKRIPKMDPRLVAREHVLDGVRVVLVLIPGGHGYYTLPPVNWELIQLFDGERTYEEIAELFAARTGMAVSGDWVLEFANDNADAAFWSKTLQEKNARFREELAEKRRARTSKKSKWSNLAEITFPAWDPDVALTKVHERVKFIFTYQFLLVSLAMFAFAAYVLVSHWTEIGQDNLEFYNFTHKSLADIIEFWVLVCGLACIHEFCHGLGCKHTGGESHAMGFLLIYLSPAFYCDTTEAWVYGSKWQRIATIAAGVWSTMVIYSIASFVWWGTAVDSTLHNFSYIVMLASGILGVLINVNPLIKLDGYYMFTELLDIPDLKENATLYVNNWVRKNIFRLPVEVPYATWRRKLLYVPYTLASGVYSYGLLYVVVTFVYNVIHRYNPEWAFVPAALLAIVIFKSRILTLWKFMRLLYLDKKDRVKAWFTPRHSAAFACLSLLVVLAPVWRETVEGRLVLEPVQRAVVRVEVPGTVMQTNVDEGQNVSTGAPLLRLRNLGMESEAATVAADLRLASARVLQAQIGHKDFATAEHHREELTAHDRALQEKMSQLTVLSPIAGTVVTPRVHDLLGAYLPPGNEVMEIANTSMLQALVYISAADVGKVRVGAPAALRLDARAGSIFGNVTFLAPASSEAEKGLFNGQEYKGIESSHYYVAKIPVPNSDEALKDGFTGTAKVFVRRRSIAGFAWQGVDDFLRRKLW